MKLSENRPRAGPISDLNLVHLHKLSLDSAPPPLDPAEVSSHQCNVIKYASIELCEFGDTATVALFSQALWSMIVDPHRSYISE